MSKPNTVGPPSAVRKSVGPVSADTMPDSRAARLHINLRDAQALGLTIPPHVLLQATEVIQ